MKEGLEEYAEHNIVVKDMINVSKAIPKMLEELKKKYAGGEK